VRNDRIALPEFDRYDKIIISPGPGIPSESGVLPQFLKEYADRKPILGVCLGHQAIGERFGARLRNLEDVYHGIQTPININVDDYIFAGLERRLPVGRYHSWIVDTADFPAELEITATDDEGNIMAMRHRTLDVRGVQFHPESILTPDGLTIFDNWLKH
jgi:anthranilate synthase component 2